MGIFNTFGIKIIQNIFCFTIVSLSSRLPIIKIVHLCRKCIFIVMRPEFEITLEIHVHCFKQQKKLKNDTID